MFAIVLILFALSGLVLINLRTAEKIAPADRLGLSLIATGIGVVPFLFNLMLFFLPSLFFLTVGVFIFAFVPTDDFYMRRNERSRRLKTLRDSPSEVRNPGGIAHGLCPNCEALIPVASSECPMCRACFTESAAWKVKPI
jgi:hypothetical protein